jgi:DNA-binding XRE family transcriptional regulator
LGYVDHSENHFHRYRVLGQKSVNLCGEKHGRAKLTAADVIAIRELFSKSPFTHQQIASMYGVTRTTITSIHRGINWRHSGAPPGRPPLVHIKSPLVPER